MADQLCSNKIKEKNQNKQTNQKNPRQAEEGGSKLQEADPGAIDLQSVYRVYSYRPYAPGHPPGPLTAPHPLHLWSLRSLLSASPVLSLLLLESGPSLRAGMGRA